MTNTLSRRNFMRMGGIYAASLAAPQLFAQDEAKEFMVGPSWYSTGLTVKPGDKVKLAASGLVSLGGSYLEMSRPEGWSPAKAGTVNDGFVIPAANRYSLIGCIGDVSKKENYFLIGKELSLDKIAQEGTLLLSINDDRACDNTGGYDVAIEHNGKASMRTMPGHGGFWVNTGFDVEARKSYQFTADGVIDIGGAKKETSTPKGWDIPVDGNYPLMTAPRYSLIGCIGDISRDEPQDCAYFYVGDNRVFTAQVSGRLSLGVNDHEPHNNTGAYKVKVAQKK